MTEHTLKEKEEILSILQILSSSPQITQREISSRLGISVGKTNYLLKELIKKGLIKKVVRFKEPSLKLRRIRYLLTSKGFAEKAGLIYMFFKKKEAEYQEFKRIWEESKV